VDGPRLPVVFRQSEPDQALQTGDLSLARSPDRGAEMFEDLRVEGVVDGVDPPPDALITFLLIKSLGSE
jgi:hypothetical protein